MDILVENLQFLIDRYIDNNKVPNLTLDELRERIFQEFEENDKKRGIPYLTPARSIVAEYINYSDDILFEGREKPYTGADFSFLMEDELSNLPEVDSNGTPYEEEWETPPPDFLATYGLDYNIEPPSQCTAPKRRVVRRVVKRVVKREGAGEGVKPVAREVREAKGTSAVAKPENPKRTRIEEILSQPRVPTPEEVLTPTRVPPTKKVKRVVKVKKRIVKQPSIPKSVPPVTDSIDDLLTDIFREEPKPSYTQQKIYANIRDLVMDNNGCTYDFVLKQFPQKQLTKDIEAGKIYMKNGRLYA